MSKDYIEFRDGGYFIAGSRVSLDSVVYAFLRGESPEGIAESWPAITLEQIFGALSYYLANRGDVDEYLAAGAEEFRLMREQARQENPAFYAKLAVTPAKVYTVQRASHLPLTADDAFSRAIREIP